MCPTTKFYKIEGLVGAIKNGRGKGKGHCLKIQLLNNTPYCFFTLEIFFEKCQKFITFTEILKCIKNKQIVNI